MSLGRRIEKLEQYSGKGLTRYWPEAIIISVETYKTIDLEGEIARIEESGYRAIVITYLPRFYAGCYVAETPEEQAYIDYLRERGELEKDEPWDTHHWDGVPKPGEKGFDVRKLNLQDTLVKGGHYL
jgi:hypothetical protein